MGLTCTCIRCRRDRPVPLVRESNGAKPPRMTQSDEWSHKYVVDVAEPCTCGCTTVKFVYDMRDVLGR